MKISIRTFTIITVITLTLSGLTFSGDFPATTTTTPSGRTSTTSITDNPVRGSTTTTNTRRGFTSAIPEQPVQQKNESDAAFLERTRAWENRLNIQQLEKLQSDLSSLPRSRTTTGTRGVTSATSSDNILVIPTEEMKTESLLAINEDMNVMSQIFRNELKQNGINFSDYGEYNSFGGMMSGYGLYGTASYLGRTANKINSMYIQGYGALFMINVDFLLSAPSEAQEQPEEPNKGEVDQVWQQMRQQIYEPQVASANSYIGVAENLDVKYDAQKVENLKKTLITALKHASNIKALNPDESIIIRISETSTLRASVKAILNNQYLIQTGNGVKWIQKEDLPDNIKNLPDNMKLLPSPLNAIVIRAKKSDIDFYAKGELNFDKFREKVQVFSYPIFDGNSYN